MSRRIASVRDVIRLKRNLAGSNSMRARRVNVTAMATHELYERRYAGDLRADLRKNRDDLTAEIFGNHPLTGRFHYPPPGWPAVPSAQAWTDVLVARDPIQDWQRVLECPVCRARDVVIERVPEHDANTVDCPTCGVFVTTGPAFTVLGDVYFGMPDLRPSLVALSDFLRLRVNEDDKAEWVTAEHWQALADAGRRLRRG